MTRKEWANIRAAAEHLGLGDEATLAEIKKAYRRLSKKYHPDLQESSRRKTGREEMYKLTEAYQALLDYCTKYRFPLKPGDKEELEGEDWWFERFGQDHHWGRGSAPNEDSEE